MPTQCATKPLEFEGFGRCRLLAKKLIFLLVFLSVPSWSFVPLRGYFLSFLPLLGQLLRDLGVTSCPSHRSSGPGCSHPPA